MSAAKCTKLFLQQFKGLGWLCELGFHRHGQKHQNVTPPPPPPPPALTLNYIPTHCMHLLPISWLLLLRRSCSHTSEQMFLPAKLLCCQQPKSSGDCADTWKVFTNRRTSPRNEWPLCASHFSQLSCSQLGVGGVRVQMGYSQGSYSISAIQHVGQENLHTHVQMFLTVFIVLIHCLVKVCPVSFFFWLQISRLWEYGWNMD